MIVSWNGRRLDETEVRISAFDGGLLRGQGVFETMRADRGRIDFWGPHYDRLCHSAGEMSLTVPAKDKLQREIQDVLKSNSLCEQVSRVRLTLSKNLLITALPEPPPALTCDVVTVPFPVNERSPLAGAKVCSYAENMVILESTGANEAIRPNTRGNLCEGCISNVFFVKDGTLHTPSLETGCLPGIVRSVLVERNPGVREGCWPVTILEEAEEIWLTSSTRLMTKVDTCDGRTFGPKSEFFERVFTDLLWAAKH